MKKEKFEVLNTRAPRVDAVVKATGRAQYAADLNHPGQLYGAILQSPYAHARILNIDTSKALRLPGVKAVITAADVGLIKYGVSPARYDETLFAHEKVRYVGDEIAAVAAIDAATAREALKLIKVDYEELPAVLTIEEALAYVELMKRWDLTQETLAARLGRNRSTIANTVRLLQLSPKVQQLLSRNELSAGHARAILALPTFESQEQVAAEVVEKGLSVRDVERLVKRLQKAGEEKPEPGPDPFVQDIQDRLERSLGTKVKVTIKGKRGSIKISFFDLDELDGLIRKICT